MNQHMKFGLRFKLIAGVMTIVFGIMGSMTFILLEKMRHEAIQQRLLSAQAVTSGLEGVLELYETIDTVMISRLLNQVLDLPSLLALRYSDRNFNPVLSRHPELLTSNMVQQLTSTIRRERLEWSVLSDNQQVKVLAISIPLHHHGTPIGGVLMVQSLETMERDLHYFWGSTIKFITVEYVVIIIFLALLLSMTVIRPIERMVAITHRIADGEFDHKIEITTSDEIGELARALTIMSDKLKSNRESLEAHVISLKQAYQALQQAQQEILRTEKLACVGHLAAGVAHEIGNPLSAVLGYLDLLQDEYPLETKAEFIQRTRMEIARIEKIIRGLLDFSRPSPFTVAPCNLPEILAYTLPLICAHKSFKNIVITQDIPRELPLITGDAGLLQQVLFNILLNAAQAMNGQGTITLKAHHAGTDQAVVLDIIDEGPGIPEDLVTKVMEPFYTTKPSSEGTGLGLAICQRIMEQIHGTISLTNRKDRPGLIVTLGFKV